MSFLPFVNPYKIYIEKQNDFEAQFEFRPLESGYGQTIGNALRRVLLSSLSGYAVVGLRIFGINHEFSTVPGVLEDVLEIILNLKQVRFKKVIDTDVNLEKIPVSVKNKDVLTARMLNEFTTTFEVANPDFVICHLDPSAQFNAEIAIARGCGYVPAEESQIREIQNTDFILTDAIYTPVKNVQYKVSSTRVEQRTDFEKLSFHIKTDGTIHPEDALKEAARVLMQHLMVINGDVLTADEPKMEKTTATSEETMQLRKILKTPLEDLDLSVRAFNCLKSAYIGSLSELVQYRSEDLMKFRNFGQKSLIEIEQVLRARNLHFGMDLSKLKDN